MSNNEKSIVFKQKWACEKHPTCLYCIPCECENCTQFEKTLRRSVQDSNLKKDCASLQKCRQTDSE